MTVFDHMKNVVSVQVSLLKYHERSNIYDSLQDLLDQVVQMIDKIHMDDRDTKGDFMNTYLSKIASAGNNGQFRTPRHIIKMMVDMVNQLKRIPSVIHLMEQLVFLVACRRIFHENHPDWFYERIFRNIITINMFTGIEIDSTMLRIGAMNLSVAWY